MRTTVVLKDDLVSKAKQLSSEKTLSGLLNQCLADWVRKHSLSDLDDRLAKEYREGAKESRNVAKSFGDVDTENWPSWRHRTPVTGDQVPARITGHDCM